MLVKKAFAAITNQAVPGGTNPSGGASQFARSFAVIWRTIIIIGGLGFLLFLLWGGLDWLLAGGDKQRLEEGRGKMRNALLGLAILAGSYVIVEFVGQAVGIDLLNIVWPSA